MLLIEPFSVQVYGLLVGTKTVLRILLCDYIIQQLIVVALVVVVVVVVVVLHLFSSSSSVCLKLHGLFFA